VRTPKKENILEGREKRIGVWFIVKRGFIPLFGYGATLDIFLKLM